MVTIEEQISYLGKERFIKYTNTEDFPELSLETRHFLKQYGLFSHGFDNFYTDGKIKRFKENLLEIGVNRIDDKYCIDVKTGNIIIYDIRDNSITIYNSSVQRFQEVRYTIIYYYSKVENKLYGNFYKNNNHIKYAKKFREMLNEVEPTGIENFVPWEEEIYQKELGVH